MTSNQAEDIISGRKSNNIALTCAIKDIKTRATLYGYMEERYDKPPYKQSESLSSIRAKYIRNKRA